jgi:hypothetical protein
MISLPKLSTKAAYQHFKKVILTYKGRVKKHSMFLNWLFFYGTNTFVMFDDLQEAYFEDFMTWHFLSSYLILKMWSSSLDLFLMLMAKLMRC